MLQLKCETSLNSAKTSKLKHLCGEGWCGPWTATPQQTSLWNFIFRKPHQRLFPPKTIKWVKPGICTFTCNSKQTTVCFVMGCHSPITPNHLKDPKQRNKREKEWVLNFMTCNTVFSFLATTAAATLRSLVVSLLLGLDSFTIWKQSLEAAQSSVGGWRVCWEQLLTCSSGGLTAASTRAINPKFSTKTGSQKETEPAEFGFGMLGDKCFSQIWTLCFEQSS